MKVAFIRSPVEGDNRHPPEQPYYFPLDPHYFIWSCDSYIMVIHSSAFWSRGLFLECYLKLAWLISGLEVQWFQQVCIYLLEFHVFRCDLLWRFAAGFAGGRGLLGVNCDVLASLISGITRPKVKCTLLLSWETSLHLASVVQQQELYWYLHRVLDHLGGLGQWLGMW